MSVGVAWWLIQQSSRVVKNPEKIRLTYRSPEDIDPATVDKATREHLQELQSQKAQGGE